MSNNGFAKDLVCRLCGSDRIALWTSLPKTYYKCFDCNFISVNPLPTDAEIEAHYKQYHDKNHQAVKEKNDLRRLSYKQEVDWLSEHIEFDPINDQREFKVFDFGCSGGYFLDEMKNSFKMKKILLHGYDRSEPAIKILKEKGYFVDYNDRDNSKRYDLVIIRGVIEHVVPFKELFTELTDMLSEKGYLFITATPNGNSPCATLYRHNWVQHHYPSHIQHFNSSHFDYLSALNGLIRVRSADLYADSPYKKAHDDNIFISMVQNEQAHFNKVIPEEDKRMEHAFFESMLTLLFRKV